MRALALFVALSLCLLAGCGGGGSGSGSGNSGPAIVVSVTPTAANIAPSTTETFTATVTNTTNTAVTWSVLEAAGGSITSAGVYTAPAVTGTYHVVATSKANPSKSAIALVSVHVVVTISPTSVNLSPGESTTFTATVTGSTNTAVAWRVEEGTGGGTITADGVYTPNASSGTFHVIAISQADTTQQAIATVVIQSGSATGTIN